MTNSGNVDLENFRNWYVETLKPMYARRESGIAVFMLSFPLLERYLRQKNELTPKDTLNDAFMKDLCTLFPAIENEQVARQFWNVFRNGFLHQATLSQKTNAGKDLPAGILSHDLRQAVAINPDDSFLVQPVLFSQNVIQEIEQNFTVFSGVDVPLPTVNQYRLIPEPLDGPNFYEGTSAVPISKK